MEIEELDDPIELFRRWYADAEAGEPRNANAMSLASLGPDGLPSIGRVFSSPSCKRHERQRALSLPCLGSSAPHSGHVPCDGTVIPFPGR